MGIQGSRDIKLQPLIEKNEVETKCLFMLEDGASCSTKVKGVDKDGEEVLAHCEKHSEDSVELTGLCKLLFFTIWVGVFAVCLVIE